MSEFVNFLVCYGFNLLVALILVRGIYYPSTHDKRYVFTFMAFNTAIFFVVSLMSNIEIGVGVGFGLFAIFSILRYRTDPLPVREMTYLFVISALPVMNAAALAGDYWAEVVAANAAILAILFILEKEWGFRYEGSRRITYEKVELIRPNRRLELINDLEERTGLKIKRITIGKTNFLRDTVDLTVYFDSEKKEGWSSDIVDADFALLSKADDD